MDNKPTADVALSKFLSLLLRHSPQTIHLTMDENGWVDIEELIANAYKYKKKHLNIDMIKNVVKTNDKQRYSISADGKKIRANQGHSIDVDVELECSMPPDMLYHGTAVRFLDSIMKDGLKPMSRQYVHLSLTEEMQYLLEKDTGSLLFCVLTQRKCPKKAINFIYPKIIFGRQMKFQQNLSQ